MNFKIIYEKYNIVIFYLICVLIIGLGLFIRLNLYLKEYPFWADETLMSLSFFKLSLFQILSNGLLENQKAPPLFSFLTYIIVHIAGYKVTVFRFIPQISSILVLIFTFLIGKRIFNNKLPIIISLFLTAISGPLIYYSNEFRPYEFDVFIGLLLIFLYKYIDFEKFSIKKFFIYVTAVFLFAISSFPAIFFIAAILLLKIIEYKKIPKLMFCLIIGLIPAALILINLNHSCAQGAYLESVWELGWLKLTKDSFILTFTDFLNYMNLNVIPTAILSIIGFIMAILHKKKEGLLIITVFLITILASLFKIYPLHTRVSLYMIPFIIFFIAKSCDLSLKKIFLKVIYNVLIVVCILLFVIPQNYILSLYNNDNICTFHQYSDRLIEKQAYFDFVNNQYNNEPVFATQYSNNNLFVYRKLYNLNKKINICNKHIDEFDYYSEELEKFINENPSKNLWLLFDHFGNEQYNLISEMKELLSDRNSKITKIYDTEKLIIYKVEQK